MTSEHPRGDVNQSERASGEDHLPFVSVRLNRARPKGSQCRRDRVQGVTYHLSRGEDHRADLLRRPVGSRSEDSARACRVEGEVRFFPRQEMNIRKANNGAIAGVRGDHGSGPRNHRQRISPWHRGTDSAAECRTTTNGGVECAVLSTRLFLLFSRANCQDLIANGLLVRFSRSFHPSERMGVCAQAGLSGTRLFIRVTLVASFNVNRSASYRHAYGLTYRCVRPIANYGSGDQALILHTTLQRMNNARAPILV